MNKDEELPKSFHQRSNKNDQERSVQNNAACGDGQGSLSNSDSSNSVSSDKQNQLLQKILKKPDSKQQIGFYNVFDTEKQIINETKNSKSQEKILKMTKRLLQSNETQKHCQQMKSQSLKQDKQFTIKQINQEEHKKQTSEHQYHGNFHSFIKNEQKKINESQKHCQQKKSQSLKQDKQFTIKQINQEEHKKQTSEHQYNGNFHSFIKNEQKKINESQKHCQQKKSQSLKQDKQFTIKQINQEEHKKQTSEHQYHGNFHSFIKNEQKKINESQKHRQQKKSQSPKQDKQFATKQINQKKQKQQILEHQYFVKINSLIKKQQKKQMMDGQKLKNLFQKFSQQTQKLINNRKKTDLGGRWWSQWGKSQSLKQEKQLTKQQISPEKQKEQILELQHCVNINSLAKNQLKKINDEHTTKQESISELKLITIENSQQQDKINLKEHQQNSEHELINNGKIQINDITQMQMKKSQL